MILAYSCYAMAAALLALNLANFVRIARGGAFRSSIMVAPTVLAAVGTAIGGPWWALALIAVLDLGLPLLMA